MGGRITARTRRRSSRSGRGRIISGPLGSLLNALADAILIVDEAGQIVFANTQAEQLFGHRRGALMGQPVEMLVPEALRERHRDHRRQFGQHPQTRQMGSGLELAGRRADGRTVPVDVSLSPVEWEGRPFVIASIRDATELRRREQELQRLHGLLEAAIEQTPAGVIIADAPDVRIRVANAAALGIRGQTTQPLVQIPVDLHPAHWQTFHPDGRPCAPEDLPLSQAVLYGKESRDVEVIIRRGDGEPRWVAANAAPVRNAAGEIIAGIVVFADITERKQAEASLRASEARYRSLYASMREGVALHEFIVDAEGRPVDYRILDVNPAYEQILGLSRDRVVGQLASTVYGTGEAPYLDQYAPVALTGEPVRFETTFTPMGKTFLISAFRPAPGQFATVFEDVTARLALQHQLSQAQKMEAIGRLASGIAHDFNNQLTAMLGYSDLILDRVTEDHGIREDLLEIRKASERAAALTQRLLAFTRQQVLAIQSVNLNDVVRDLETLVRRVIGEDLTIDLHLGGDLWTIQADRTQLEQVVMNLVVNARDAMPHGGTLTIETANIHLTEDYTWTHVQVTPGPHVVLTVRDTGIGMDAETQAHIFEPFFTTKEKGKGTGLGLSTVYGIVSQLDGHVWVYSEPGQGATFKLYFPAGEAVAQAARAADEDREAVSGGSERILLVEDDGSVRSLAARILTRHGYTIVEASTAEEALGIAADPDQPLDLVVTDVVLPDLTGPDLADRLQALRPLRLLFMSGYANPELLRRRPDDAKRLLQKPFAAGELLSHVREALTRR